MAHVIIKCRVTFGKKMFNDCIKPHSICMRLVLSTQEEFSLKRAHYGHSPLPDYTIWTEEATTTSNVLECLVDMIWLASRDQHFFWFSV